MVKFLLLALFLAAVTAATAQEKDSPSAKYTGECSLPDGAKVAQDGSCGIWTATLKEVTKKKTEDDDEDRNEGEDKNRDTIKNKNKVEIKNQLKVATLIDLEYLVKSPPTKGRLTLPTFVVHVCVTTPLEGPHDAHKADWLIIAVTDAEKTPDKYCEQESLAGEDCIKRSSKRDICYCKGKAKPDTALEPDKKTMPGKKKPEEPDCEADGTLRWCLKKKDKVPTCRYLPLRAGQKLSAWITRSKDPAFYSPMRTATGTWALMK